MPLQDLDCGRPLEQRVPCEMHVGHATFGNRALQSVRADAAAGPGVAFQAPQRERRPSGPGGGDRRAAPARRPAYIERSAAAHRLRRPPSPRRCRSVRRVTIARRRSPPRHDSCDTGPAARPAAELRRGNVQPQAPPPPPASAASRPTCRSTRRRPATRCPDPVSSSGRRWAFGCSPGSALPSACRPSSGFPTAGRHFVERVRFAGVARTRRGQNVLERSVDIEREAERRDHSARRIPNGRLDPGERTRARETTARRSIGDPPRTGE